MVFPHRKHDPTRYRFSAYHSRNSLLVETMDGSSVNLSENRGKREFLASCRHRFTDMRLGFDAEHMDRFLSSGINRALNLKQRVECELSGKIDFYNFDYTMQKRPDAEARHAEHPVIVAVPENENGDEAPFTVQFSAANGHATVAPAKPIVPESEH